MGSFFFKSLPQCMRINMNFKLCRAKDSYIQLVIATKEGK